MADAGLGKRAGALTLALGLQALLAALLIHSISGTVPLHPWTREMSLLLAAQPKPPPPVIEARKPAAPAPIGPSPAFTLPPQLAAPAPPAGIAGFGRAMFGCAPENIGALSAEDRARCDRTALAPPPRDSDLAAPPSSHARDEALWQEQWAEAHWQPALCPVGAALFNCLMDQIHAEHLRVQDARRHLAAAKAAAMRVPGPPLPRHIGAVPRQTGNGLRSAN